MISLRTIAACNDAAVADLRRTMFRMSETPPVRLSLADELGGGIKADALAEAFKQFCEHGNRARFESEVRRIRSCHLATRTNQGEK